MTAADNLDLPDLPAALCAQTDAELWFPDPGGNAEPAKNICHRCPELEACLAYALTHDVLGVWGATTQTERQNWRRDNQRRAVSMSTERIVGTHAKGQRQAAA